MKWSIVWIARVDEWVAAVVRCLPEWETRSCQREKVYADIRGDMLELAMAQRTMKVRVFVQYWVGRDAASGTGGEVTQVVKIQSTLNKFFVWTANGLEMRF